MERDIEAISRVYNKFKLHFYKEVIAGLQNRELSLSTVEVFCVEIIAALGNPTMNEFAEYCNISSPNATYKVNSLIQKGYITKEKSATDKREYILRVTDKYYKYYNLSQTYVETVMTRLRDNSDANDYSILVKLFEKLDQELMPEVELNN